MNTNIFNPGLAYSDFKQRKAAYITAALVAFLMSSYFVVGYLAGDLLIWNWSASQWLNGVVATGLTAVMTAYQFFLYSQGDITGGRKATIVAVCVAVGFSLLSEIGQGMERDHIRMETKSLESPTYKAIVSSIGNGTAKHPYSTELANAQMKLARCKQKVADGIWKDCIESTARLNAVNGMIEQFNQTSQQNTLQLANTAKAMEKDEKNYHPLVNLIRETIGATGTFASFILSLILISFFEYAFHYLGRQYAESKRVLLNNGYDVTRRTRKPPRSIIPKDEAAPPTPEPSKDSTWNRELSKNGIDSPDDETLNRTADQEQIQRILDTGRNARQLGIPSDQSQLDSQLQSIANDLYPIWKSAVKAGECSHAKAATQKFIWQNSGNDKETLTANETKRIWENWKTRGVNDHLLTKNPEYKPGNRKPEFILA